jgi:hypothetical protein
VPPPPQAAEFLPTASAGKSTLKFEKPLAGRAPSVIPGLEPTEWRKINASMPSLEALSPFMESLTPLIAPIGRWGGAYAALCEAVGLPRLRGAAIMRAATVPNNHLSKIMVPIMTTLTANVPWDRVLDPSTVWVSKGLQAMAFSSDVMEMLVKTGKVHRLLPGWKARMAQKAADAKMDEVDALADLLNREVAGGGGGALGMGAPTAASRKPASRLEAAAHVLGAKLTPEVVKYDAISTYPKPAPGPGEADVASPMAPRKGAKAAAKAAADKAAAMEQEEPAAIAFGGSLKDLKKLLADPARNPFLSADPPKYVEDRAQAAKAVVGAKQAIVADVKKSVAAAGAAAGAKKAEGTQQLFGALKGAAAATATTKKV